MQLEWVAPPECPPQATVLSRVKSLAGERAAARELRVLARVVRVDAQRWRLALTIGEESPEPRIVESDECTKLANATALIVSLDLQELERREQEEIPAPSPAPPRLEERPHRTPPRATQTAPLQTVTTVTEQPAVRGVLGARLMGDAGSLPAPVLGVGFSGALVYKAWRAQVGATLWGRSTADVDGLRGAGATTFLRTGDIRGCWRTVATSIELDSCAGVEAGGLRAAGFGVRKANTSVGTWFAALLGLSVRYRTSPRLGLSASIEVGVPILVPEAVVDGIGRIYSPAPIFGRAGIGLETLLF